MTSAVHGENRQLVRPQAAETLQTSKVVSLLTAEFLTPGEVAALLKVSRWTLADWRLKRQGPPFELKARGVVVYPRGMFESFLRLQLQASRGERRAKGLKTSPFLLATRPARVHLAEPLSSKPEGRKEAR